MKKKLLLIMLVVAAMPYRSLGSIEYSDDSDTLLSLHLYMADSTHVLYALNDYPVISFVHDSLCIESEEQVSYFWHGDIVLYTFTGQNQDTTLSSDGTVVENQLPYRFQDGNITIYNMSRNVVFSLYTIDGKLLQHKLVSAGTNYTMSLQGFPTSVYLIQINGITYKIVKP